MTHNEKILLSLRRVGSRGACTEELTNEWHIRRVAARIHDLRTKQGHVIAKQRCRDHGDARYVLVEVRPRQTYAEEPDYDFDGIYADMKERANDPPDPEPPADEPEDAFHTSAVWGDDGADFGHDSATDRALGEGVG